MIMLDSVSRNSGAVHAGDLEDRVMEFVVDNKESLAKRCARGHTSKARGMEKGSVVVKLAKCGTEMSSVGLGDAKEVGLRVRYVPLR
jgi:hypothetical protein